MPKPPSSAAPSMKGGPKQYPANPPLWRRQPAEFISDAFPRAQAAVSSMSGRVGQFLQNRLGSVGTNWSGYGLIPDTIKLMPPESIAGTQAANPIEMNKTAAHEAAHSIWADLPQESRDKWLAIHKKDPHVAGFGYMNDPTHAFAEAYGSYAAEPVRFQRESPEAYKFLRDISGFEYARPKPSAR